MNKINKVLLGLLVSVPIIVLGAVTIEDAIVGLGSEENPTLPGDILSFSGVNIQDNGSGSVVRMEILPQGTIIDSKLYGEYGIKGTSIELRAKNSSDSNCSGGESLEFFGVFEHTEGWFGDLEIQQGVDNYYCYRDDNNPQPTDGNFSIPVVSLDSSNNPDNTIGQITFTGSGGIIGLVVHEGIYVNGSYLSNNTNIDRTKFNEKLGGAILNVSVGNGNLVSSKTAEFNKMINKNIEKLTRGKISDTGVSLTSLSEDLYYYNYEGQSSTSSNVNNKGKILEIKGTYESSYGYNKLAISGHKTIIVKGGNVYINTDIVNNNLNGTSDLLVIVAKRDPNNRENGGNIYIDPKVTNIDAVLIADGSVLSYNGSSVETDLTKLGRQLFIYGSVSSKNVIGKDIAPYGSDEYKKTFSSQDINPYDLVNLRRLHIIRSTSLNGGNCNSGGINDYVAIDSDTKNEIEYAFAGKPQCFWGDTPKGGLRGLSNDAELASVVIKYNPAIQTNPPEILSSN